VVGAGVGEQARDGLGGGAGKGGIDGDLVHVLVAGGLDAVSRAAMVGSPSLSTTRQVNIWVMTGPRTGSTARRVLVRPSAALAGTGWGTFSGR